MPLEQLVRPFQQATPFVKTAVYVQRKDVNVTNGSISWGQGGDVASPVQQDNPDDGTGINFKLDDCVTGYLETKRTTQTTRVSNPEDDSQFVDVQRIKEISFTKATQSDDAGFNMSARETASAFANVTNSIESAFSRFAPANKCDTKYNLNPPK